MTKQPIKTYKLQKNKKGEMELKQMDKGFLCKASEVNPILVELKGLQDDNKDLKKLLQTATKGFEHASIKCNILERILKKNKIEIPKGRELPPPEKKDDDEGQILMDDKLEGGDK